MLEVRREGIGWALPGAFLHEGERLIDAVRRSLRQKAGVTGLSLFIPPTSDQSGR